jgi:hypothetical protein
MEVGGGRSYSYSSLQSFISHRNVSEKNFWSKFAYFFYIETTRVKKREPDWNFKTWRVPMKK